MMMKAVDVTTVAVPLVLVDETGLLIFRSVADALDYVDVAEIEDAAYRGFDGDGRLLSLSVAGDGDAAQVVIASAEPQPTHAKELMAWLRAYLAFFEVDGVWLANAPLPDLIAKALQLQ